MKKIALLLLTVLLLVVGVSCEDEPEGTDFSALSVRGVTIALDAEAAPIVSALGEPRAFAETNSCYGDGKDKVYEYQSFKVTTYSMGGKDYILAVEIFDDVDATLATPEGIAIGAGRDAVIAAYGEAGEATDAKLVYVSGGVKLRFLLTDGRVTSIKYLKAEAN